MDFRPARPTSNTWPAPSETFEEKALFGELGYRVTDRWQVTLGARWFDYDDDLELLTAFPFFASEPGAIEFSGNRNKTGDDDVIFKFNSSYEFNDDVMGYLTISEGYRRGGLNSGPACEVPPSTGQSFCLEPDEILIKPDTTTNYEIGLRSTWFDGRLQVNAALYLIDWEDIQVLGTSDTGERADHGQRQLRRDPGHRTHGALEHHRLARACGEHVVQRRAAHGLRAGARGRRGCLRRRPPVRLP